MMNKKSLIIANALLWMAAGINIARIGIDCAIHAGGKVWLWAVPVFAAFFMMFRRTIGKNIVRIMSMPGDKAPLYRFMSLKGYVVIIFMMTLGISLRSIGSIPDGFFAFFYSGLGSALFLAGAGSLIRRTE